MPFRFQRSDDRLQTALRRIATSEIDAALSQLPPDAAPTPGGVHDIRKRMKKLRGLARLLRPGFPDHAAENAALRDVAQHLSVQRDAAVRLATFDGLFPELPDNLAPLRARLMDEAAATGSAPAPAALVRADLVGLRSRAAHWRLAGKDHRILAAGFARSRRQARSTMAGAMADPSIEALHEWRKRAKDVWCQTRLLTPIWPEVMSPLARATGELTEGLGRHHDLAVLAAHVATLPGHGPKTAVARLVHRQAQEAQRQIEAAAFATGQRLFAGDPQALADLWVRWWKIWRA